jgi:hypothetical protein
VTCIRKEKGQPEGWPFRYAVATSTSEAPCPFRDQQEAPFPDVTLAGVSRAGPEVPSRAAMAAARALFLDEVQVIHAAFRAEVEAPAPWFGAVALFLPGLEQEECDSSDAPVPVGCGPAVAFFRWEHSSEVAPSAAALRACASDRVGQTAGVAHRALADCFPAYSDGYGPQPDGSRQDRSDALRAHCFAAMSDH